MNGWPGGFFCSSPRLLRSRGRRRLSRWSGEQSRLVIRATWGPKPFATGDVNEVLGKVDAFFGASSFGRVSFTSTVTP
jgi:hypothetical protein